MDSIDTVWVTLLTLGAVCILASPFISQLLPAMEKERSAAQVVSAADSASRQAKLATDPPSTHNDDIQSNTHSPAAGPDTMPSSAIAELAASNAVAENSAADSQLQTEGSTEHSQVLDDTNFKKSPSSCPSRPSEGIEPIGAESVEAPPPTHPASKLVSHLAEQTAQQAAAQEANISLPNASKPGDDFDFDSVLDEILPAAEAACQPSPKQPEHESATPGQPQWLLAAAQRASALTKASSASSPPAGIPASLQVGLKGLPLEAATLWARVMQADSTAQLLAKPQPPLSNAYSSMQTAPRSASSGSIVASHLDGKPVAPGSSLLHHLLAGPSASSSAARNAAASPDVVSRLMGSALLCSLQRAGVADEAGKPFVPAGTPLVEAGRSLGQALPRDMLEHARRDVLLPMLHSSAKSHQDIAALLSAGDARVASLHAALEQGGSQNKVKSVTVAVTDDDALLDGAFDF